MPTFPYPSRTLSSLGYPGYSDEFAARVIQYVIDAEKAGYPAGPDAYACAIAWVYANPGHS